MTGDDLVITRFMSSPRWDGAFWCATTFRWHPDGLAPPIMGIVFANALPGRELFRQWVNDLGNQDVFEELRISIIEGDIPGQAPGYSVHICPDPENVLARATAEGIVLDVTPLVRLGRANRMHPLPGSPQLLPHFKEHFETHQEFLLTPVTARDDGQLWVDVEFGIEKTIVHFRNVVDITDDDIDSVVLHPESPLTRGA